MFNTILCTTLVVLCIGIIGCIWCLCRIASKQTPTPWQNGLNIKTGEPK